MCSFCTSSTSAYKPYDGHFDFYFEPKYTNFASGIIKSKVIFRTIQCRILQGDPWESQVRPIYRRRKSVSVVIVQIYGFVKGVKIARGWSVTIFCFSPGAHLPATASTAGSGCGQGGHSETSFLLCKTQMIYTVCNRPS